MLVLAGAPLTLKPTLPLYAAFAPMVSVTEPFCPAVIVSAVGFMLSEIAAASINSVSGAEVLPEKFPSPRIHCRDAMVPSGKR